MVDLQTAEKKASKLKTAFDLVQDIGNMALSATGVFHIGRAMMGVEPPADAPPVAKLVHGGILSDEDEALIEGIEQELRTNEETAGVQGSLDRLRVYTFDIVGDKWYSAPAASWNLTGMRKQILKMRLPERQQTTESHAKKTKEGEEKTVKHTTVKPDTTVAKQFLIQLHKVDMAEQGKTDGDQVIKEHAGCVAMADWLYFKSMPGPRSAQNFVKLAEKVFQGSEFWEKFDQKQIGRITRKRQREAEMPRWRRWLRS